MGIQNYEYRAYREASKWYWNRYKAAKAAGKGESLLASFRREAIKCRVTAWSYLNS